MAGPHSFAEKHLDYVTSLIITAGALAVPYIKPRRLAPADTLHTQLLTSTPAALPFTTLTTPAYHHCGLLLFLTLQAGFSSEPLCVAASSAWGALPLHPRGLPQPQFSASWLPSWRALPYFPAPCVASSRPVPDSLTGRLSAFTRRGGVGTVPVPSTGLQCVVGAQVNDGLGAKGGRGYWSRGLRCGRPWKTSHAECVASGWAPRLVGWAAATTSVLHPAFSWFSQFSPPHVAVATRVSASCSCSCSSTWQHARVVCAALSCDRK